MLMGWRRPFDLAITGLALALLALPAHADGWDDCKRTDFYAKISSADADVIIRGCSAIIDAGADTAKNLAIAYYNRANAYQSKDDWGRTRAIEDYDRAVALNPKYEDAQSTRRTAYNRACVWVVTYLRVGRPASEIVEIIDDCTNNPV